MWSEDIAAESSANETARRELPLYLEIRAHSPTGFAWGYAGSGPAQLALALLADALGNRELAQRHYQSFKWAHVSKWEDTWLITAREIRAFVAEQERTAITERLPNLPAAVTNE